MEYVVTDLQRIYVSEKQQYVRNNRMLKMAHEYLHNHHIARHVTLDRSPAIHS